MQAEMIPLIMLFPEMPAMMVSPNRQTRKYSAVPSWADTGHLGRQKQQHQGRENAAEGGCVQGDFNAALVLPLLGQGMAVQHGGSRVGRPRVLIRMAERCRRSRPRSRFPAETSCRGWPSSCR